MTMIQRNTTPPFSTGEIVPSFQQNASSLEQLWLISYFLPIYALTCEKMYEFFINIVLGCILTLINMSLDKWSANVWVDSSNILVTTRLLEKFLTQIWTISCLSVTFTTKASCWFRCLQAFELQGFKKKVIVTPLLMPFHPLRFTVIFFQF